jgi:hypothetical protein
MMRRRQQNRMVSLSCLIMLTIIVPPQSAASAFTAIVVISIQQSHDRLRTNKNLYPYSNRHHPSQPQPRRSTTRQYLAQNSNSNRRQNQTADVQNETETTTPLPLPSPSSPLTASAATSNGASSSSVSLLDEFNDEANISSSSSDDSGLPQKQQEPFQKTQALPEPALLSNNESESESIDEFQNEIDSIESETVDVFQNEIDRDDRSIQLLKHNMRAFLREPLVEVVDCGLVLLSSLLVAVSTLPDLAPAAQFPIQFVENTIGSVFAVEFLVRWYSVNDSTSTDGSAINNETKGLLSDGSVSNKKGILYFTQPSVLVDIVAVILPLLFATQPSSFWVDSTFVPNWLTSSSGLINLRLLRILRLQRVLQDMDTFTKFEVALGISDSNVKAWQLQLARTVLSIFTLLSVSTGLIYTAEHDVNPNIPDYFTALYFGLTTLTTVGFGDIVPVSWEGRLVVSGSILAGVAVIPAQAAVLVEALLARQEERQAAIKSSQAATNTNETDEVENDFLQQLDTAVGDTVSNSVSDPIRQEVAAQAAKRRHTLVHGSNPNSNGNAANENTQQGRMVLETEVACSSCGSSMHWSSAKFCWSCGEQMV